MHLSTADLGAITLYVVLMLWIAYRTRKTPEFLDFSLARKSLPYVLIFASLSSTFIGPGFSIGAVDKGFETGYYSFFLFLPFAVQTILVGWVLAPRLAALDNCASIGDFMGMTFNRPTRVLTGLSSVAICIMFTGFLAKVAGEVLSAVTGLSFAVGVVIVTALSLSYTLFGGIRASVVTDTIQFGIFTIAVGLVALLCFVRPEFNVQEISRLTWETTVTSWHSDTWLVALGVGLSFLLGETLIPPYASRALASSSPIGSKRSFLLAGSFCVFWLAVVTAIGIGSRLLNVDGSSELPLLLVTAQEVLPRGLTGVLVIAIVGILMSSQDSVLNAGAVAFTRDLVRPWGSVDEKRQMLIGQGATALIALIGAISAGWLPEIIDALVLIYSIWAATVLIPFVFGLLVTAPPPHSGWLAIALGGLSSITWTTLLGQPFGIPSIIPGVLGALIGLILGYLLPGSSDRGRDSEPAGSREEIPAPSGRFGRRRG